MDRREFVKLTSAGAAGTAFLPDSIWRAEDLRVAVIGPGSRGAGVMRTFLRIPGVRVIAAADVYEPRFAEVRRHAGEHVAVYTDYRRMLEEQAKNLDAVIVASPPSMHAEHVAVSLERGLHVYGEKLMAFDVEGVRRIIRARKKSGKVYMVGHQYRYAPFAREAIRRVRAGEIGEVTHVYAYWHRNNNWRRAVPTQPVPGFTMEQLERLLNWRLYRATSHGLLGELGSHQIDLTNWMFDALPQAVIGTGSIAIYQDGRETFDNVQVTFEYPRGKRLFFSSVLSNHKLGYQLTVLGTGGTLDLTLEDATFYYEPKRSNSAVPELATTGASLSTRGDLPYRGPGEKVNVQNTSADLLAVTDFVTAIRENGRPMAHEGIGLASAIPVAFGDRASQLGTRIEFAKQLNEVRHEVA